MDRLTLDSIAAQKAGMSYGKWKALQPREVVIPKEEVPIRVCRFCGKELIDTHPLRLYCDDGCKHEVEIVKERERYRRKKERMIANGKI